MGSASGGVSGMECEVLGVGDVLEFDEPESIQHTHVDNRSYTIE